MRKLKFLTLTATVFVIVIISLVGCKKTTTNNTVVKDSIYYSPWTTLSTPFNSTDSAYEGTISASMLTQNAISNDAILGYLGFVSSAGDTATEQGSEIFEQVYAVGQIQLFAGQDLSGYLYRYVIIPGTVLQTTSLANLTRTQLQHMSFTDVQKALNAANTAKGATLQ